MWTGGAGWLAGDDQAGVVLIVDDDDAIRESIDLALQMDNHTTAVACNGGEALEWLGRHQPPCSSSWT